MSLSIAEVAKQTGMTAHTLRYYEKEALIPVVPRDLGGRRSYSERHVQALRFVSALRATGMPIRDIRRYLALYAQGESSSDERLALLEAHRCKVREELTQVQANLKIIEQKIARYRQESRPGLES